MRLKRHYKSGADGAVPVLAYVEVQHTGTTRAQHFSAELVAAGLTEGWISIHGDVLTLQAQPESLRYTILRVPGKYPCASAAAGYEVIHYYDCVLDAQQQAAYGAKTEAQRREDLYLAQGITPKRKAHVKEVARG